MGYLLCLSISLEVPNRQRSLLINTVRKLWNYSQKHQTFCRRLGSDYVSFRVWAAYINVYHSFLKVQTFQGIKKVPSFTKTRGNGWNAARKKKSIIQQMKCVVFQSTLKNRDKHVGNKKCWWSVAWAHLGCRNTSNCFLFWCLQDSCFIIKLIVG